VEFDHKRSDGAPSPTFASAPRNGFDTGLLGIPLVTSEIDTSGVDGRSSASVESGPIALGSGWSHPDIDRLGPYRLAEDGADIELHDQSDGVCVLELAIEPAGPATRSRVGIASSSGATFATIALSRLQLLRAVVPAERSDAKHLRLTVASEEGGRRVRVRSIKATGLHGDVLLNRNNLALGNGGWHALETFAGEVFRWIENDAEIIFLDGFRGSLIAIEVAPGPSILGDVMNLAVLDDCGRELVSARIDERRWLEVPVDPASAGGIRLRVWNGGAVLQHDSRILNMRVFGIRILEF
jgi:hypothetical protein